MVRNMAILDNKETILVMYLDARIFSTREMRNQTCKEIYTAYRTDKIEPIILFGEYKNKVETMPIDFTKVDPVKLKELQNKGIEFLTKHNLRW